MDNDITYALVAIYGDERKVLEEGVGEEKRDEFYERVDAEREKNKIEVFNSNNASSLYYTLSVMRKDDFDPDDYSIILDNVDVLTDKVKTDMVFLEEDDPNKYKYLALANPLTLPYITIRSTEFPNHKLGTYFYESDLAFMNQFLDKIKNDSTDDEIKEVLSGYLAPSMHDLYWKEQEEKYAVLDKLLLDNGISVKDFRMYARRLLMPGPGYSGSLIPF